MLLTPDLLRAIVDQIPDDWLGLPGSPPPGAHRAAYLSYLTERLSASPEFLERAEHERAAEL